MEKVLLINPAHTYYNRAYKESVHGSIGLPLGLLYIAAALEKKGCMVQVVDSLVSEHTQVKHGSDYVQYGIPPEMLGEIVRESEPDIVGISSQFTAQEGNALRTAEVVKNVDDSILVIVGGSNASCRGRELLATGHIDIAVTSEAEEIICELLEFYRGAMDLNRIKGIAFRNGQDIVQSEQAPHIKELDEVGFPAYHLVDMERYLTLYEKGIYTRDRDVTRNISMITSRGCPYRCVFCSISQSMGKVWRPHSADFVIKHIETLSTTYGVRHIHFEDDNLLFKLERFSPILEALSNKHITWDTPNGIRVDLSIKEEMLQMMRRSGCKSLTIGVESGDEGILRNVVKKDIQLADVEEFARRCKKVHLPLRAFFVLGFPGETMETMERTIDFAMHLLTTYDVEIINLIATPLYGTELYDICSKNHYFSKTLTPRSLSESTVSDGHCLISTDDFSSEEVERMSRLLTAMVYRRLVLKNILHPIKSMKRIGNLYTLKRVLKRMSSIR